MITVKKELDETDSKILSCYRQGKTNKEIAKQLNLTIWAITNRARVMKKYFGCSTIAELVHKTSDSATR